MFSPHSVFVPLFNFYVYIECYACAQSFMIITQSDFMFTTSLTRFNYPHLTDEKSEAPNKQYILPKVTELRYSTLTQDLRFQVLYCYSLHSITSIVDGRHGLFFLFIIFITDIMLLFHLQPGDLDTTNTYLYCICKNGNHGTSLVAQWLRICLPLQGTWVQSLVWEDPTCRRATKPMHHNY